MREAHFVPRKSISIWKGGTIIIHSELVVQITDYQLLEQFISEKGFIKSTFLSLLLKGLSHTSRSFLDRFRSSFFTPIETSLKREAENIGIYLREVEFQNIVWKGNRMLKIEIDVGKVNYDILLTTYLPTIMNVLKSKDTKASKAVKALEQIHGMPQKLLYSMLDSFTEEEKEQLIVTLFGIYKEEILQLIRKQQIPIDVVEVELTKE